ncbi:MAG: DUF1846 domain-containing protein [Candidatus Shapirobacteria bacterium]
MRIGFDTERYLKAQKKAIEKRLKKFDDRLYLEFGGKLLDDFHAVRTLPGYEPNTKLRLLKSLKRDLGVIYCVSAKQLQNGKVRGDYGIGYDLAAIKAIEDLKKEGLRVEGVVINRCEGEREVEIFLRKLRELGIEAVKRKEIKGYPNDVDRIVSDKGYGADEYLKPKSKLVVVWGPGPGSGKLSTCLGQIYHEVKKGMNSGYAKFETFPVWNLDLDHPINVAYEAATADLGDFNLIDPHHKKAYGKEAVNYNRDVETFSIMQRMFEKLLSEKNFTRSYRSPTDMGFNVLKEGMINDKVLREAAKKEINFYVFRYREEYKKGLVDKEVLERMEKIMKKSGIEEDFLPTVKVARSARNKAKKEKDKGCGGVFCGAAIELKNGEVVYGKNSPLLYAEAAMMLNAIKKLAGINDEDDLVSDSIIRRINDLNGSLGDVTTSLNMVETVIALAVSARDNPLAQKALEHLTELRGCFMHTTHRLSPADAVFLRKLGAWVSTDGEVG